MAVPHCMASGMGGMRTAGDLVARLQMTRRMKIDAAKEYVADKLKVSVSDLGNEVLMREVREDFRIGIIQSLAGFPKGIEAKHNIADLLDIRINSVEAFKSRSSME
ncbi:MAG: hypothetical protein K9K64_14355 [Desulfohalobiaceae bacterium]|nr:hypothetical protein [Desulfohalobiaceae bacterium]